MKLFTEMMWCVIRWSKLRFPHYDICGITSCVHHCHLSSVFEWGGVVLSFYLFTEPSAHVFFEVRWVYFLCFPTISVARLSFSTFLLDFCFNNRFFWGRDVTYNECCHAAWVTTGICPCTCRRSPAPTRVGLWTAWFCSMRWQSGWRMTSPSPLQREFTCTASTSKEPAGTAAAASSSNPNPKSSSRWCLWSGCMPWTMVRFPIHWWDGGRVVGVGGCNWSPDCSLSSCLASETETYQSMWRTVFILEVLIIFRHVGRTRSLNRGVRGRLLEELIHHLHHTHSVFCLQLILSQFSWQEECLLGLRASL